MLETLCKIGFKLSLILGRVDQAIKLIALATATNLDEKHL